MDRRSVISALAAAPAAVMASTAVRADDQQHSHSHTDGLDLRCALTCSDCVAHCENCVAACLEALADGMDDMMDCIKICQDCADICRACAASDARGGPMSASIMKLCIESCQRCVAECEKHDHPECQACAKACRACIEACQAEQ
ncbi:four-helix bundle copper-binding protein [Crateriforma spongiae]|uniref:four-helix bundle copper-binding protein n=1 Tax=Crateriforma spongiae TaxID=2724528 RepID=UPI00197ED9DE|nr:four-helix bundle copper-binding protein [Crateriforma spongiae]